MLVGIGILVALASWVANSIGGIVFGIVMVVIGLASSKSSDPIKKQVEKNKKRTEEMIAIREKLDNDRFATILRKNLTEDEFRHIEDSKILALSNDISNSTGVKVLLDKVQTIKQTFYYDDYNVNFNNDELEELAIYLQSIAGNYTTTEKEIIHKEKIIKTITIKGETHYFETPGGHLSSYDSGGSTDIFQGYRVYITGKKVKDTNLKEW